MKDIQAPLDKARRLVDAKWDALLLAEQTAKKKTIEVTAAQKEFDEVRHYATCPYSSACAPASLPALLRATALTHLLLLPLSMCTATRFDVVVGWFPMPRCFSQAAQEFRAAYLRVVDHWKGPRNEVALLYKTKLAKLHSLIPLDWNLVRAAATLPPCPACSTPCRARYVDMVGGVAGRPSYTVFAIVQRERHRCELTNHSTAHGCVERHVRTADHRASC